MRGCRGCRKGRGVRERASGSHHSPVGRGRDAAHWSSQGLPIGGGAASVDVVQVSVGATPSSYGRARVGAALPLQVARSEQGEPGEGGEVGAGWR